MKLRNTLKIYLLESVFAVLDQTDFTLHPLTFYDVTVLLKTDTAQC